MFFDRTTDDIPTKTKGTDHVFNAMLVFLSVSIVLATSLVGVIIAWKKKTCLFKGKWTFDDQSKINTAAFNFSHFNCKRINYHKLLFLSPFKKNYFVYLYMISTEVSMLTRKNNSILNTKPYRTFNYFNYKQLIQICYFSMRGCSDNS